MTLQHAEGGIATRPSPPARPSGLPPPQVLRAEENRDGMIDRLLAREEYRPVAGQGKNVLNPDAGISKPYMFVEKDGVLTIRQNLDNRNSLTALEYIQGSLSLLHNPSAYQSSDKEFILKHVLHVATDALTRPWVSVRNWSQHVWDCIELGRFNWDDSATIHEERIRVSYTSGPVSGPSNSVKLPGAALKESLCRDFNSTSGCKEHGAHIDGEFKLLHACAFCDSMGRRFNHSFQRCRSRQDFQGGAINGPAASHGYSDGRQWSQQRNNGYNGSSHHNGNGRTHGYSHQGNGHQQAKN